MDDNIVKNVAFNGLDYVSAFRAAFDVQREADKRFTDRVSLEHMETFFFVMTVADGREVELRHIQKSLDYLQAKMHRTVKTLETLGWITISPSPEDARQKVLTVTDKGKQFFVIVSKYVSTDNNQGDYAAKSAELTAAIEIDAQRRAALSLSPEDGDEFIAYDPVMAREHAKRFKEGAFGLAQPIEPGTGVAFARNLLKGILLERGYVKVETGKNYVATATARTEKTNIVTFPVLLKRTGAANLEELARAFVDAPDETLTEWLTPTPRTKMAKLEVEKSSLQNAINGLLDKYGATALDEQPNVRKQFMQWTTAMSLLEGEIELEKKALELKAAAIESGRWSEAMDKQAERFADAKPGKLARWDDWDKEINPALKRIYGRAIERNELAKSSTTDEDGSET